MNCGRFQRELFEYVDGTLSTRQRAAAEEHLTVCAACREAVRNEQLLARCLSDEFRRSTETLVLDPAHRRRVESALQHQPAATARTEPGLFAWSRLAWSLGFATGLLVLATWLVINHLSGTRALRAASREPVTADRPSTQAGDPTTHSPIAIEISYRVPTYRFRREGNMVVDTVSDEIVFAVQEPPKPE